MERITSVDYRYVKRIYKEFELKNLGDYHDLYVQIDTLLLVNVLENFRNKCIEIYEFDPAHFLSAPVLAWQACFKKTRVKLELLRDIDIVLMVEKGIRGGICHAIYRYAKANNRYMKNYYNDLESSYLEYLDANNLYGWAMSRKRPVNGFEWLEELFQCNKDFTKDYDEDSNKKYFLEVDVEYPKNLLNLHGDIPFLPERNEI